MKVIIFAGGSGKRFWPISREKFPKQFQPIINNKSTIEMLVDAVANKYDWHNIYFSTTENLVSLIKNVFPQVPTGNIITEPTRRDVGPAVGLSMAKLQKLGAGDEPVTVLWSDSFASNEENFSSVLDIAEKKILESPRKLVWLGQKPKFANENLGWIEVGELKGTENGISYYQRKDFKYRPTLELAQEWLKDGNHLWNTGYFVTSPNFILEKYKKNAPAVWNLLEKIMAKFDTEQEVPSLNTLYPQMPSIHFDNIVLDYLKPEETLVIEGDFDWSDPGTLYALKQHLQQSDEDNVCKGNVYTHETKDSLVYNYVNKQVVSTVGLDGFVIVNTPDALLVCHKNDIGKIKDLLEEFKGTDLEKHL